MAGCLDTEPIPVSGYAIVEKESPRIFCLEASAICGSRLGLNDL
jgi:hypothetical protein